MTQPAFIDQILNVLDLDGEKVKMHNTPVNVILFKDEEGKERLYDPSLVLSRTVYILTLSGCPISWVSKMQTEITLATTKAEYIALSQSMQDLILIRSVLKELSNNLGLKINVPITHSTFFKDNNGVFKLTREVKYR